MPSRPQAAAAVASRQTALNDSGITLLLLKLSSTPVRSGATMPANRESADAMPEAVPLYEEENEAAEKSAVQVTEGGV